MIEIRLPIVQEFREPTERALDGPGQGEARLSGIKAVVVLLATLLLGEREIVLGQEPPSEVQDLVAHPPDPAPVTHKKLAGTGPSTRTRSRRAGFAVRLPPIAL
jgi:hypothetical protein